MAPSLAHLRFELPQRQPQQTSRSLSEDIQRPIRLDRGYHAVIEAVDAAM